MFKENLKALSLIYDHSNMTGHITTSSYNIKRRLPKELKQVQSHLNCRLGGNHACDGQKRVYLKRGEELLKQQQTHKTIAADQKTQQKEQVDKFNKED